MMRARPSAGFTLVEVLVALAVFSLLAVGAYETLRTVVRGWDATGAHAERLSHQRTAERFLRARLAQAVPIAEQRGSASRIAFTGGARALALLGDLPPHLGAGLHELRFAFEASDGEEQLLVRFRPATSVERIEGVGEFESTVLLGRLESGGFEYYGPASGDGPARWQDEWRDTDRLPELVRVRWKGAGARAWPDVVVAPRPDGVRQLRRARETGEEALRRLAEEQDG